MVTQQATYEQPVHWTQFVVGMTIYSLVAAVALFASAGRVDWWQGWVFILIFTGITVIGRYLVYRRCPELLKERATALGREDTKSWDKVIVPIVVIFGPFAQIIIAGFDFRWQWSPDFPIWIELIGIGVILLGYLFGTWSMLVNQFYSSAVRIQSDRGQYVVQEGPYAIVRHPSYTGAIIGSIGVALILGSIWSLIPALISGIVLIIRTKLEDDTLKAELEGYVEYTQKTRYRLVPRLW